jgi:two-component system, NarL family, sensor histidine kinase UhpB
MPPAPEPLPQPASDRSTLWRDVAFVAAATVLVWLLAIDVEFSERLLSWTRDNENLQLDELPTVLIFLSASLAWLTWRRYREAAREIDRRRLAEARLEEAMLDNRRLAQEYLEVQESERRHLAHELHDELGQYLNAIKIDAVALRNLPEPGGAASRESALGIIRNVDHVHTTVRDMMQRLRPAGLDELGLGAALEQCVDTWRQRCPETRFSLELEGDLDSLGEAVNLTVYRFVQEGLTNATRHAQARHVDVRIRRAAPTARQGATGRGHDEIVAELADDGRGADLGQPRRGLGLLGMRERVAALGGQLAIESAPGQGFRLVAALPASPAAPDAAGVSYPPETEPLA